MKPKNSSRQHLSLIVVSLAVAGLSPFTAQAANGTWLNTGATNGNWNTTTNWVSGTVPGSTAAITGTNADASVVTFNTAVGTYGTTGSPVVIDSTSENISGISFDTSAGNYFIGATAGNSLYLSSGGTIQILSTLSTTNAVETINAPLVIEGASGTYNFLNNSANGTGAGAGTLNLGGQISGGNAGATVLTLGGINTNANTISGKIINGTATTLAVIKSGAGTWVLGGANTYTGGTTISAGQLTITNASGLGTGSVAANGGTVLLNAGNVTYANAFTGAGTVNVTTGNGDVTLTGAMSGFTGTLDLNQSVGGASKTRFTTTQANSISNGVANGATIKVESGTTLYLNQGLNYYAAVQLFGAGNTENLGALRLETAANQIGSVTLFGNSSIGTNGTAGTISGVIGQSGGTFGFAKVGNNTLNLTNANTYGGTTTVSAGTLNITGAQSGGGAFTVSGGTLSFAGTGSSASSAATNLGNQQLLFNAAGNGTSATTRLASVTLGNQSGTNPGTNGLVISNTGNTTATTDTISGNIILSGPSSGGTGNGISNVIFAAATAGGASETLQANGITQGGAGNILSVNATTGSLGTNAFLKLTNVPTQLGANGTAAAFMQSVIPWIYNSNGGVMTYDATKGIILASTTGLVSGNTTQTNVSTSGTTNLAANTTVNSLTTQGSAATITGSAGVTLTVTGGSILFSQATTLSVPTIDFGVNTAYIGNSGRAVTISGVITGSGGATFFDTQGGSAGTTVLSGANTYTGVTNVSAGGNGLQLVLDNTLALQNSTLNLTSGSIAIGIPTDNITALTLGGLSGSVNINLTNAASTPASVALTVGGNGDSTTYSGILANGSVAGGSLTKAGAGTLTLSGSNTYTGGTTVNAGTLKAGSTQAFGVNSAVSLANTAGATLDITGFNNSIGSLTGGGTTGGNVILGAATLTVGGNNTSPAAYAGVISGTGTMSKTGTGTLTLSGPNSYNGTTTISNGTLKIGNATALGNTTGNTTIASGATLDLNGQTIAENFGTIAGTGVGALGALVNSDTNNAATISGAIGTTGTNPGSFTVGGSGNIALGTATSNGAFTVTKIGEGILTLGGSADNAFLGLTVNGGTVILNKTSGGSAHSVGSGMTLTSGTVKFSGSGGEQIFDGNAVAVNGGTFDMNGKSETIGTLTGNIGALITNTLGSSTSTLTVGGSASATGTGTYAGSIQDGAGSGVFALTKGGTGTMILSGANTHSGATTISGGVLSLANTLAAQNSIITNNVASGLTFNTTTAGSVNFTIGGLGGSTNLALNDVTTTTTAVNLTLGNSKLVTDTATYTGILSSGAAGQVANLIKTGAGTQALNAANTYAGTTTINGGILSTNNLQAGGTASGIGASNSEAANLVINGGALTYTGAVQSTDRNFTIGSNNATINASGSAALTLTGAASYAVAGQAQSLTLGGTNTADNTYTGALVNNGAGALSLIKNDAGVWSLTNTGNTYSGGTTINAGTLRTRNTNNSLGSGNVTIGASGTLDIIGNVAEVVTNLSGAGIITSTFSQANSGLSLVNSADTTFSGVINNQIQGGITKSGAGMLTLTNSNTYTGATAVNSGTLNISSGGSLASGSAITVQNTGSTLSGAGTVNGNVNIKDSAILAPGDSGGAAIGKISVSTGANTLTLETGSIFAWSLATSTDTDSGGVRGSDYDAVDAANVSAASDAIFRVILGTSPLADMQTPGNTFWSQTQTWSNIFSSAFSGFSSAVQVYSGTVDVSSTTNVYGTFTTNGSSLTWSAVPEPATGVLAGLMIGAGLLRRRR